MADLPPEGRRCSTLLDLGIAFTDGRIEAAAELALGQTTGDDRRSLVAQRTALEDVLTVPDGWPLLYREQLFRLEAMAREAEDTAFLRALDDAKALLHDCAQQTETWWRQNGEAVGQLAAIEALLARRA